MHTLFSKIFRLFLTGIATLLPFIVTIFVGSWIIRFADAYIGPSSSFGVLLVRIAGPSNKYPGYLIGYLIIFLLIILLGFLVTRATVARIHEAIDSMFVKIPLFGRIYMAVGQMVEIFGKKDNSESGLERFGGVGHVKMGNVRMFGLLTSNHHYFLDDEREYVLVFIPNSPIPATGFNALVPAEDFTKLDMPIEDMAKVLMSLGLLGPQVLPKPAP